MKLTYRSADGSNGAYVVFGNGAELGRVWWNKDAWVDARWMISGEYTFEERQVNGKTVRKLRGYATREVAARLLAGE